MSATRAAIGRGLAERSAPASAAAVMLPIVVALTIAAPSARPRGIRRTRPPVRVAAPSGPAVAPDGFESEAWLLGATAALPREPECEGVEAGRSGERVAGRAPG